MKSIIYEEMKCRKRIEKAKNELQRFISENNFTDLYVLDNFEMQIAAALMIYRDFDVSRAWQIIIERDFIVFPFDYETYVNSKCDKLKDLEESEEQIDTFLKGFVFLEYKFDLYILNNEEWHKWGNIDGITSETIGGDFTDVYKRDNKKAQGLIKIAKDFIFYCKFHDVPLSKEEIQYYKELQKEFL